MQSINTIIQTINPGVKTHQMGGHPPIVSILNMKEGNKYTISIGLYERGGQRIFTLYFRNYVKEWGGGDDLPKQLVLVWWGRIEVKSRKMPRFLNKCKNV